MADELTVVQATGIPWRFKVTEPMGPSEYRMLYALMDAVLVSIRKESKAPRKRRPQNVTYIPDDEYNKAVSRLKKETVILDHSSEEDLEDYLAEKPSDNLIFRQLLQGMLLQLPHAKINLLSWVLWALNTYVLFYLRWLMSGYSEVDRDFPAALPPYSSPAR